MASMKVANPQACEDFCAATDGCNAASYYLDGTNYGDRNCWLKTIANPCERPEDAMADANSVLLLKLDATCALLHPSLTYLLSAGSSMHLRLRLRNESTHSTCACMDLSAS